ncbi:MAG: flagellar hook capping protein [Lachnospiraceae bacterium]|nr:flagellar hook capping protein [Lachnospiraceae bacterium]
MGLLAAVENGQFVESVSQSSLSKATKSDNSAMDKDAFLQLLVAQMKYQDPMEPTSNTEYISQYAQFSQVEQIQNMAANTELQRASTLVGKDVYIKTTTASGEIKEAEGKVDYVKYEGNKAYLSINGSLYSLDDLDTIADADYLGAYNKALDLAISINKLPNIKSVDMTDAEKIDELTKIYDEMSDYEKSFVAKDIVDNLNQYRDKLTEVRATEKIADFTKEVNNLPDVDEIDLSHAAKIDALAKTYDEMGDVEKELLTEGTTERLNSYRDKLEQIRAAAGESDE